MWAGLGKYVGGKVLTAVLVVLAFGCGLWAWKHPEELAAIGRVLKYAAIWLGIALVLPWASFPVVGWVVRRESNVVAGLLLSGLAAVDVFVALCMTGVSELGILTWMVLVLGFLCGAIYNFLVCNFQAERLEDSV
ncbi:MAG: hypothetical protein GY842_15595 [bacterium]|nr:hypothetical protein [bacterium]